MPFFSLPSVLPLLYFLPLFLVSRSISFSFLTPFPPLSLSAPLLRLSPCWPLFFTYVLTPPSLLYFPITVSFFLCPLMFLPPFPVSSSVLFLVLLYFRCSSVMPSFSGPFHQFSFPFPPLLLFFPPYLSSMISSFLLSDTSLLHSLHSFLISFLPTHPFIVI